MAETRLYDYTEVLNRLSIGRSTLNKLINSEELVPTRIGRKRLFSDTELERFIAAHTNPTNAITETSDAADEA